MEAVFQCQNRRYMKNHFQQQSTRQHLQISVENTRMTLNCRVEPTAIYRDNKLSKLYSHQTVLVVLCAFEPHLSPILRNGLFGNVYNEITIDLYVSQLSFIWNIRDLSVACRISKLFIRINLVNIIFHLLHLFYGVM